MPDQPTVTTLFFTDLEGSSRLWEVNPEGMKPAMAEHDALLRRAVIENHGEVVKMMGDGVSAAFVDPLDALRAALAIQLTLEDPAASAGVELRVRCGIHCGVVERRDNDYFGSPVNRAARIMSAAHGGQVLVTQAVVDLIAGRLPAEVSLRDLGSIRLRDLAGLEHLHQLEHPKLRREFPALRSLAATPNNLPQQVTSFVGREPELAQAKDMLERARLLTLCGAGGIGKTRLSLELAAGVLDDFPDGVSLVELAPLTDGRLVTQAVASAVGVKESAGRTIGEALVNHVAERDMLLIFDNCEHLLDSCAELAAELLQKSRTLRIVASSRERLHVPGEVVYSVPSLSVPDADTSIAIATLSAYEAVRLFVERAAAATGSFTLAAKNRDAVVQICRQLDGIPLAIELAAARTRAFSVDTIAARIGDRFRLLSSGSRTALPRQQTLRALIDWSYDLLDAKERTLLQRLSVFAGSFTLEAAEAVCMGGDLDAIDIVDVLAALVEKSLLANDADNSRFRMLETIRQYAHDKLAESGEEDAIRSRHLEFYLLLAEEARTYMAGPEQAKWLARLDFERENILAAHRWCDQAECGEEFGLRLVHAVKPYWRVRGVLELGHRITLEAVARSRSAQASSIYAQSLFNAGQLALWIGRYEEANDYLNRSLAMAREIDDKPRIARTLQPMGAVALALGDYTRAHACLDEALLLARAQDNPRELAGAMIALAQLHRMQNDLDAAEPLYQDALARAQLLGDREAVAVSLLNLAMVAIVRKDELHATSFLLQVIAIAEEVGSKSAGQSVLEVCAGLACVSQEWNAAARFYGMVEAQADYSGIRRDAADEAFLRPLILQAESVVGSAAFLDAVTSGRDVEYETAIGEAKSWLRRRSLQDQI